MFITANEVEVIMNQEQVWEADIRGCESKVIGLWNNNKVMIKGSNYNERYFLVEYFAAELGKALGLKINEVKLADCGPEFGFDKNLCSVHIWEDDFITANDAYCKFNKDITKKQRSVMNFFDAILNNDDRHESNYGFINDELFLIDHGISYPWCPLNDEDEDNILLHAKENFEIAERFLLLDINDFRKMLDIPYHVYEVHSEGLIEKIFERMFSAQDLIGEVLYDG